MKSYIGVEFEDGRETGRRYSYPAESLGRAVENCLYFERLSNGQARVGPTGDAVHAANRVIVIVNHKEKQMKTAAKSKADQQRDRRADQEMAMWEQLAEELPPILENSDPEIARIIEERYGIPAEAVLAAFRTQDGGESSLEAIMRAYAASRV